MNALLLASFASFVAGAAVTPEAAMASSIASSTSVGTNLAPISDWSTQRPFADLFKQSRGWISNSETQWDDGRALDVDARGWIRSLQRGQRARAVIAWDEGAAVVRGDVVVTWRGKGKLDFWPQKRVRVDQGARRAVIDADGKSGIAINILETDASDPVRDIRVSRAGHEGKRFDPAFLQSLRGYTTLRFMDWARTNDTTARTWAERAVVDDARWSTAKGVPLEVMIELCNEVDADMWLTIPDTWDDAAVSGAASMVAQFLEKERALYVESSNEVWNDMFPQAKRARERGAREGLSRNANEARLLAHAARTVDVMRTFTRAWSERRRDSARLVRVIASHMANPWSSGVLLSAPGVAGQVDALAIAPYFGHDVRSTDVDDILRILDKAIDGHGKQLGEHKVHADRAHVALVAYEGGQHLIAAGPGGTHAEDARAAAFAAANRDPRMRSLYAKALSTWKSAGGGLYVHYYDIGPHTKFGAWGARERVDQTHAPKLDALMSR